MYKIIDNNLTEKKEVPIMIKVKSIICLSLVLVATAASSAQARIIDLESSAPIFERGRDPGGEGIDVTDR